MTDRVSPLLDLLLPTFSQFSDAEASAVGATNRAVDIPTVVLFKSANEFLALGSGQCAGSIRRSRANDKILRGLQLLHSDV
jgi:hypothetical protein